MVGSSSEASDNKGDLATKRYDISQSIFKSEVFKCYKSRRLFFQPMKDLNSYGQGDEPPLLTGEKIMGSGMFLHRILP